MTLLSLYIAATIFGVGVTAIDLLGFVGDQNDDGEPDGDGNDGDDGDVEGDASSGKGSIAGHDRRQRHSIVMRIMSATRSVVYFSLGFGPVGWFGTATGETVVSTLVWSSGVGAVILVLAHLLRRLLRSELNSNIKETDTLLEKGTVTVRIQPGALGRIRLKIGAAYTDRYARTRGEETLDPGVEVRVVDIDEDCLVVEREKE